MWLKFKVHPLDEMLASDISWRPLSNIGFRVQFSSCLGSSGWISSRARLSSGIGVMELKWYLRAVLSRTWVKSSLCK